MIHVQTCDQCKSTVFEMRPSGLVIRIRHHGDQHVTVIPLDDLERLIAKVRGQRLTVHHGDDTLAS